MKKLFLLLTLLLCTSMAWAHDVEVDGIFYNLNQTNKTAAVTFKGSYFYSYDNEYSGEVVIPQKFIYDGITYSVTSLEWGCFFGCTGLTSITIPNSVTSLGSFCFNGCTGLTSVTIPNSVTSLGEYCFQQCTGLTSITIPNSVTSLGDACFAYCERLESIEVESGNTVYDSRENCNAIIETSSNTMIAGCKNTKIPNSVTSLGGYCFFYCTGLTSITIPNSVTSLGG